MRSLSACLVVLILASGCGDAEDSGVSTAGSYVPPPGEAIVLPDLSGAALWDALDRDFSPAQTLGYSRARDVLYAHEQEANGALCGLYTDFCVTLGPGDPSIEAQALHINAEHVWPQSMGAEAEPFKSDLHHLFPARDNVNSSRGNLPFGEIPDAQADAWYRLDESQSNTPRVDIEAWSERGAGLFEPREARKGDVARAVFYAVAVYPELASPAFFRTMREDLLDWNRRDPPDDAERTRSAWVAEIQGTENPFVLDPGLADRIWAEGIPAPDPEPPAAVGPIWINEVHYDNDGADVGEGVEVAGAEGASLDGWRLVFVNGMDQAAYREVTLSGTLDGGAVWVAVEGIQNGSPDGVALVAPEEDVTEAVAWEGTFTGVGGVTDGVVFRDLGVSEGPDTPVGQSLQRIGAPSEARWTVQSASPGRLNAGQTVR